MAALELEMVQLMGLLFRTLLFPDHIPVRSQDFELEVAGAFDAFVSLEDIAPNLDWMEVIAASWGVPNPQSEQPFSLKQLARSLRQLLKADR
jgi:hypothetical protein